MRPEGSAAWRRRQSAARRWAAGALTLALAACGGTPDPTPGTIGYVAGYLGGVVADEPRAALIGRDVLSAGGSAADAAAAVYFALAVTLPSSAGLGSGGVCLIHERATGMVETLDFLPEASASGRLGRPAGMRGIYALHARHGRLRWPQVVSPAEQLARFGNPVSRALASDLDRHGADLMTDPETRRVFGTTSGQPVGEGDFVTQLDLGAALANLRARGPGDFHVGRAARDLVEASGGALSMADLAATKPSWREPVAFELGNLTVHFAAPPNLAGGVAAYMWGLLTVDETYEDAPPSVRPHLMAEAGLRAFAARGAWIAAAPAPGDLATPESLRASLATYDPSRHRPASDLSPAPRGLRQDPSGTSFAVVDPDGSAVVCNLTLNSAFGSRRLVPGYGFALAAPPSGRGLAGLSLGPMMATNQHVREFYFAAGASGGVAAPTALVEVATRVLLDDADLGDALAAKRVHNGGAPDISFVESGLPREEIDSLTRRGHRVQPVKRIGRVNAIHCGKGLPVNPDSCGVGADPRRFGLGLSAD